QRRLAQAVSTEAAYLVVLAQHGLQSRRSAPVRELVAEGSGRGERPPVLVLQERQNVTRRRHRVEGRLKFRQDADLEQLVSGPQRLVGPPTKFRSPALIADMLVSKYMGVVTARTNVEHQFERKPRHGPDRIIVPELPYLRLMPSHVAVAFPSLFRLDSFSR